MQRKAYYLTHFATKALKGEPEDSPLKKPFPQDPLAKTLEAAGGVGFLVRGLAVEGVFLCAFLDLVEEALLEAVRALEARLLAGVFVHTFGRFKIAVDEHIVEVIELFFNAAFLRSGVCGGTDGEEQRGNGEEREDGSGGHRASVGRGRGG